MANFTFGGRILTTEEIQQIDPRIRDFLKGWKLVQQWEGNPNLIVPDYIPYNYDQAIDKPEGIQDDEIQCYIWCGWARRDQQGNIIGLYDKEADICISLNGQACHDHTMIYINSEIVKFGGTTMQMYFNDKLVTDFYSIGSITINGIQYKIRYPQGYQTRKMQDYL